jgi:UDP-N-acetylmuramoylalanine--D-glutamate ligase
MELAGKKVLIVGLARTGLALARFLLRLGARPAVADRKSPGELGDNYKEALALGVPVITGPHRMEDFLDAALIIPSPGVPETIAPIARAKAAGVPVLGEVELAFRHLTIPVTGVSGTNGKTTTTTLLGDMVAASGKKVFVGGNIGNPLVNCLAPGADFEAVVAEISSFQLDTTETFRPKVAVMLNVTEDHLDRYPDMAAYAASKALLFRNQEPGDVAVLSGNDPACRSMAKDIRAERWFFCGRKEGEPGADIREKDLVLHIPGALGKTVDLSNWKPRGVFNRENAAAAALAALAMGVPLEAVQSAIDRFKGLPHRLEFVRELDGVKYYNDSKATNVDAVVRALEDFPAPVVLIMGGRDKGADFTVLQSLLREKVRRLVVCGEARGKIKQALGGVVETRETVDLASAARAAREAAVPGCSVLFSPACTSFDAFQDYAHRGRVFAQAVREM